jgi:hypothetical protein
MGREGLVSLLGRLLAVLTGFDCAGGGSERGASKFAVAPWTSVDRADRVSEQANRQSGERVKRWGV